MFPNPSLGKFSVKKKHFLLHIHQEVRAKYDCLHKWDAGNLASCAYKEYLRLNQINPDTDELSLEEKQRIASDFRAVLQVVNFICIVFLSILVAQLQEYN